MKKTSTLTDSSISRAQDIDREQWKRFVVDLSNDTIWTRVGGCRQFVLRILMRRRVSSRDSLCWVQVRLNWRSPTDSLNSPSDRRMRALRLTMVSAAGIE